MKKKKKIKKEVRFYINPIYDYKDHKLNVLKECLTGWYNQKKRNLQPSFDEFEYFMTTKFSDQEGKKIQVFECNTTWHWISKVNLFESLFPIIDSFGSILNSK